VEPFGFTAFFYTQQLHPKAPHLAALLAALPVLCAARLFRRLLARA
jgi:hypothetical protein